MRWIAAALSACLIVTSLAAPGLLAAPAEAQDAFNKGRELFVAQQYVKALPLLERSYALVPSPNSLLLIARCRRELGDVEIAAARFAETATSADAKVAAGETQYEPTAKAAHSEGDALRKKLATLRVTVTNADKGTVIITPFTRTPIDSSGTIEILHRPGHFVATVRTADGRVLDREVDLVATQTASIDVDVARPAPSPAPAPKVLAAPESPKPASWLLPTGIALGVVGAAGIATFGVLGSRSDATYRDLEESCAPTCGSDRRDEADRAEREQTIANVALGVGAVVLVTGVVLIIKGWPTKSEPSQTAGLTVHGFVW